MGGGRDKTGSPIYKRVDGVYVRLDGKPVNHRIKDFLTLKSKTESPKDAEEVKLTATDMAAMTPLPQTGRQVLPFTQNTLSIADLNDWQQTNDTNNRISKTKRQADDLVVKIMRGDISTEKGGFVYNERMKNRLFMKHNDLPSEEDVINQVIPQLIPANLREIIPSAINSTIDGTNEHSNLFVFEVNVKNNNGDDIKTYAKVHQFHGPDGNPYTVLVSLHRPMGGKIKDKTTSAQKG